MIYRNNLKNRFLTASGLSQNSHSHSGLAFRQWSLAPNVNSENPSCQNLDSSSCFGIEEILLPSRWDHELNWEKEYLLAVEAREAQRPIIWKFDFGLHLPRISLDDPCFFSSLGIAVSQFAKTFAVEFAATTSGVLLYEGDAQFDQRMLWSAPLRDRYAEFLREIPEQDRGSSSEPIQLHYKRLFSITLFAEYLHQLAAFLPETTDLYCSFTKRSSGLAETFLLLSEERFAPITLRGRDSLERRAFVFPQDPFCSFEVLQALNHLFQELSDYKVIPEALLTERWQGVDQLIVVEELLTPIGRRMLKGFEASGGELLPISLKSLS